MVTIVICRNGKLESFGSYVSENENSSINYETIVTINQTIGGKSLDYAYSAIATSDDGYALGGYTYSYGAGVSDMWVVKTNSFGEVEWNQTYGGIAGEYTFSIIAITNGGYILAGGTESYGAGGYDMWLVRITDTGQIEWNKTYGGLVADYAFPVITTIDEGYIIVGRTESFGSGASDMWVVKTNSFGEVEWNQTYGGINPDSGDDVIATSDGGYALVGGTESYGAGASDMWLVKTNSFGEVEWNQTYGGINEDRASSVITASDGGYILAGLTQSYGAGSRDMWLVKIDADGEPEWNQTYGGAARDHADAVIATDDGGYALVGRTESYGSGKEDMWVVKTNITGQLEWSETFGGVEEDAAYSIIALSEREYVLVGRTKSYGSGSSDLWLLKINVQPKIPETTTTNSPAFEFYLPLLAIIIIIYYYRRKVSSRP
jgi:hypothetical protein